MEMRESTSTLHPQLVDQASPLLLSRSSEKLNDLEEYIDEHILVEKKNNCISIPLLVFDASSGIASSSYCYFLGYRFANRFVNESTSISLGAIAVISPAILGYLGMHQASEAAVASYYQRAKKVVIKNDSLQDWLYWGIKNGFIFGVSAVSGAPTAYVGWENFYPLIGQSAAAIALPAGYVRSSVILHRLKEIVSFSELRAFNCLVHRNYFSHSSRHYKVCRLNETLLRLIFQIKEMDAEDIEHLLEDLTTINNSSSDKLAKLLKLSEDLPRPNIKKSSWPRTLFGVLGGLIGAVASVLDYKAGDLAFHTISDDDSFCSFGGGTAAFGHGTVMAFAGYYCFDRLYTLVEQSSKKLLKLAKSPCLPNAQCYSPSRKTCIDVALKILPLVVATGSATPRAEFSLEYAGQDSLESQIVLYCSAIGPFLIDFWTVDSFIQSLRGITDPKQILISKVQKISNLLRTIPDDHLNAFYERYLPLIETEV